MISEHSTLVSYLPTRDSSSIAGAVPGLLPSCSSVDGIATDTSNPSVMTEQFNASRAKGRNTGQELMREEAVEAQLEPESPSCSIRTERTGHYIKKEEVENEQTHVTNIDANETVDEIEMSQGRTDKELHAIATVYGGASPPPLPPTSISREKNLEEYLSQFRQLSKSERRKLLGEVKTILDVGDKSMISGFDGYGGRGMSDELRRNNNQFDDDDDDDSLLASSEEGTALDSRVSSYYSDTSTAFYTTDISTVFFTADTRGSMYSTADTYYTNDDDNHARYARKNRNGGGGGGRRQGIGKTPTRARSRGRRTGKLYQDANGNEEDDLSEELFVAMMNFPCMSYLLCDFKSETEEANVPEQTNEINDLEADQDSWDWNNRGEKQTRSGKVEIATHLTAKNPGKGENIEDIDQIRVNCSENHLDGKCSPSFSLTSHSGMTVKERMEKLEERLFGKKCFANEEPTTSAATIMEKLSALDDTNEGNVMKKATSPDILEDDKVQHDEQTIDHHDGEDENDDSGNDCRVVQSDSIPSENITDAIDNATKDMESKLALSSCESESVGVEVNSVDAFEDNALSTEIEMASKNPILDRINNEVVVKKAKSFSRQRSESPFMKAITTLSRKSSKAGTAVDDAKLSRAESSLRNVGTGDSSVTTQRSASPFLKAIPSLTRTVSRLNDIKPVDERITPQPAKVLEQAEGTTCCNKSSATEVSDDSTEMPKSTTQHESPETHNVPASSKAVLSNHLVGQRQKVSESPIELVHQKPPRAQKKRFKMSLFTRKKKASIAKTVESPPRNKKQREPSLPTSPEITVRSVESSVSPTTPTTSNKFEYQEKTELADVMYVALRDSPVSTSTTSSAASRKRRGWKEYTDLTTGEKYYSDGVTTTWIKPVNFSRDSSPVTTTSCNDANHLESHNRGKKKGWREYIDRSTGKTYYSDGMTTSWTKPVNLVQ